MNSEPERVAALLSPLIRVVRSCGRLMTSSARDTLMYVLTCIAEGVPVPRQADMSKELGLGEGALRTALMRIEELGLVKVVRRGSITNTYVPNLGRLEAWVRTGSLPGNGPDTPVRPSAASPRRSSETQDQFPQNPDTATRARSEPPPPPPPRRGTSGSGPDFEAALHAEVDPFLQTREVFLDHGFNLKGLDADIRGLHELGATLNDLSYAVHEAALSNRRTMRYVRGIIQRLLRDRAAVLWIAPVMDNIVPFARPG